MSRPEGAPQRFEHYQPVSTLLENLDSRLRIAPWDQLDLDLPETNLVQHIESRQVAPVEQILSHLGYSSVPAGNWDKQSMRPFDNHRRGFLQGVDVHAGTIELLVEEKPGMGKAEALLLQYRHNPKDGVDLEGNPEITNDGVANVFLMPDGRIQAFVMLSDIHAQPLYYPFSPDHLRQNELAYPKNSQDAARKIKESSPRIHTRHLPLLAKLGKLASAASDIWLDRESLPTSDEKESIKLSGVHHRYKVTRQGIDPDLAERLGAPVDEHLLAGLLDESLLPKDFEIIELEDYEELVGSMAEYGFIYPAFFRSYKMGMYFSTSSLWDNPDAAGGIQEILGLNGITDIDRGLLIPTEWPEEAAHDWDTRLAYIRHQMLLQVYEDLPEEQRNEMIRQCNEIVTHSVDLRNHTYLNVEVPEVDASSPYAFKNYSRPQQEKILAGFIAGRLTLNKDLYPYWAGPPLQGEGTSRADWIPSGVDSLLEANGFQISHAPTSQVHELSVTGKKKTGELEIGERPYANPDLKIDNSGVVYVQKPVSLDQVEILEGFSLRPPLERLHRDIEEVYGFRLTFPEALEETEVGLANLQPVEEQLHDSARRTVAEALQKYPPEYIQALKLNGLRIVGGIEVATGLFIEDSAGIGGGARLSDGILYYVFEANTEFRIHHELRHFADDAFLTTGDQVAWDALNENGTVSYSEMDYKKYNESEHNGILGEVPRGFLSHYGSRTSAEDRAEFAQVLFTRPSILKRLGEKDAIIREKTEYLQELLEEESNGLLDTEWWRKVMNNERPFSDPPIFGQLISYGYLSNSSAYLDALQKKARTQGFRTTYTR